MSENEDCYKPKCPYCGQVIGKFDNGRNAPTTDEQLTTLVAAHLPKCSNDDLAGAQ